MYSEFSVMEKIRYRLHCFLIKLAYRIWEYELYKDKDGDDYAMVGGDMCALCKYCGSPTQTTDQICWKHRR